jgi:WD40 repeat protein
MRIMPPTAVYLAWALLSAPLCLAQKPRQVFTEAHYPGGVTAMAFSPDGKRLASGGLFGGLQVRDLSSGKKYPGPEIIAWCLAYHPGGKLIATGARDGAITLWDADSLNPRKTLKGHTDKVWALSFSSTGKLLASASSDKTVKLWDIDTGKEKDTLRHPHCVYEAAFVKGDKLLATGSDTLRLWDVATGKETASLKPKGSDEIGLLAVSPDGKTVAFAPDGEKAKPPVVLWDIHTGCQRPGPDLEGEVASSLAFSPDGKWLAVGVTDQALLWSVGEGKESAVFKGHYGPPNILTFSPDSGTLAASDYEGSIRLWDVKAQAKPGR